MPQPTELSQLRINTARMVEISCGELRQRLQGRQDAAAFDMLAGVKDYPDHHYVIVQTDKLNPGEPPAVLHNASELQQQLRALLAQAAASGTDVSALVAAALPPSQAAADPAPVVEVPAVEAPAVEAPPADASAAA